MKTATRIGAVVIIALLVVLSIIGCAQSETPAPSPAPTAKPAPAPTSAPATTPAPTAKPALTTAAPAVPGQKVYKMNVAYSEDDPKTISTRLFSDLVYARTGGRIKLEVYSGGSLVGAADTTKAVGSGLLDFGYAGDHDVAGEIPAACRMVYLPGAWGINTFRQALDAGIRDIANKQEEKLNYKALYWFKTAPSEFYFAKPVVTAADWKGKKVRVPAGVETARFVELMGATPIVTKAGEVYEAATKGMMEGCNFSLTSYYYTKVYEVFPFAIKSPDFFGAFNILAVNLNVWKSLAKADQDIIMRSGRDIETWNNTDVIDQTEVIWKTFKANPKMTVHNLAPDVRAEWEKKGQILWDEYGKLSPEAAKVVEILRSVLKK